MDLLQRGEFQGLVIIFLDGLDQLSAEDGAHFLDWIPATLANNMKLIVSTLPKEHGILTRFDIYLFLIKKKVNSVALDSIHLNSIYTIDAERQASTVKRHHAVVKLHRVPLASVDA